MSDNAYDELVEFLEQGEVVDAIVFGEWGWGGYSEPDPAPVPAHKQGVLLTLEEARPMMKGWRFNGGFGAPGCYAVTVWTDRHVVWVTQYDGSTRLSRAPRFPVAHTPTMPGG